MAVKIKLIPFIIFLLIFTLIGCSAEQSVVDEESMAVDAAVNYIDAYFNEIKILIDNLNEEHSFDISLEIEISKDGDDLKYSAHLKSNGIYLDHAAVFYKADIDDVLITDNVWMDILKDPEYMRVLTAFRNKINIDVSYYKSEHIMHDLTEQLRALYVINTPENTIKLDMNYVETLALESNIALAYYLGFLENPDYYKIGDNISRNRMSSLLFNLLYKLDQDAYQRSSEIITKQEAVDLIRLVSGDIVNFQADDGDMTVDDLYYFSSEISHIPAYSGEYIEGVHLAPSLKKLAVMKGYVNRSDFLRQMAWIYVNSSPQNDKMQHREVVILLYNMTQYLEKIPVLYAPVIVQRNDRSYDWYFSQLDSGIYSSGNCNPACSAMIIKWADQNNDINTKIMRDKYPNDGEWWSNAEINTAINEYGLTWRHSKNTDYNIIREIDSGKIILITGDFGNGSHSIIIWGYHKSADGIKYIYYDPAYEPIDTYYESQSMEQEIESDYLIWASNKIWDSHYVIYP